MFRFLGRTLLACAVTLIVVSGCASTAVSQSDTVQRVTQERSASDEEVKQAIFEDIVFEYMLARYSEVGATLSRDDWESLRMSVCEDQRVYGEGYFTIGDLDGVSDVDETDLAEAAWAIQASGCYPDDVELSQQEFDIITATLEPIVLEFQERAVAAGYNTQSSDYVQEPYLQGSRVQCMDGTYSNAGGKQGACSWHGGVAP